MSEELVNEAGICQNCFIKFNDYDEHFTQAKRIETELLQMYESSLVVDVKFEIKQEEDDPEDYGIAEVMIEDEEEEVSGSYDIFKIPIKRAKSSRNAEKRSYKRKKNLDEGLVVVEVDGEKIYQCDICKVIQHKRDKIER